VLLNSAFGRLAGDKVKTVVEGLDLARAVIADGKAVEALAKLVEISNAPA